MLIGRLVGRKVGRLVSGLCRLAGKGFTRWIKLGEMSMNIQLAISRRQDNRITELVVMPGLRK